MTCFWSLNVFGMSQIEATAIFLYASQNKFCQDTFLQTTNVLNDYNLLCSDFLLILVSMFNFILSKGVWMGLGTGTTWLGLGKDYLYV